MFSASGHQLLVVMRDYAGENMSDEISSLGKVKGVKNYFGTAVRRHVKNSRMGLQRQASSQLYY
jgi:hypothetical protein